MDGGISLFFLIQIQIMSERHEEPFHSNDVDRVGSQQYDVDITTRSGDQGTSCLYNGKRFPKSDIHFEVLGSLDECNSFIGLSREFLSDSCSLLDTYLENVQCLLFDVCAAVATPLHQSKERQLNKTQLAESHVLELEKWSYLLNQELPKQDSFILPVYFSTSELTFSLEARRQAIYTFQEQFAEEQRDH